MNSKTAKALRKYAKESKLSKAHYKELKKIFKNGTALERRLTKLVISAPEVEDKELF